MKFLKILIFVILFPLNIHAWDLDRVGDIEAKTWNEFLEGFTTNKIYVNAGSHRATSNVSLNFEQIYF